MLPKRLLLAIPLLLIGLPGSAVDPVADPTFAAGETVVRQRQRSVGDEIVVKLDGPAKATGAFSVVVTAPANARLRWSNVLPEGSGEPLRLKDESGRSVLVFLQPVPGVYSFKLSAQIEAAGLDPFAEGMLTVLVGGAKPDDGGDKPDDGGKPNPPPALDGAAKPAYETVKVYARLLADFHALAAKEVEGGRIKSKADFDKFSDRTVDARVAAFRSLMEHADTHLPEGPWVEGNAAEAAGWLRQAEAGFRKFGE